MTKEVDYRTFVERHNLHDDQRAEAEASAIRKCEEYDLSVVRLSFADQHGVLRGKTIMAQDIHAALDNGVNMTTTSSRSIMSFVPRNRTPIRGRLPTIGT